MVTPIPTPTINNINNIINITIPAFIYT
jgi:hypothetical protein